MEFPFGIEWLANEQTAGSWGRLSEKEMLGHLLMVYLILLARESRETSINAARRKINGQWVRRKDERNIASNRCS